MHPRCRYKVYPSLSLEVATQGNKLMHSKLSSKCKKVRTRWRSPLLQVFLSRMQLTLHATRRTPHSASRLVHAMPAWSVKTRRAPSRHIRDPGVIPLWSHDYAHAQTVYPPPPPPHPPRGICMVPLSVYIVPGIYTWYGCPHRCKYLVWLSWYGYRQLFVSVFQGCHNPVSVAVCTFWVRELGSALG